MNEKTKTYLLFGVTMLVILLFGVTMILLIGENSKCISNPFTYGAERFNEQGQELICSCSVSGEKFGTFTFNKEGVIPPEPSKSGESGAITINLTGLSSKE